MFIKINQKLTFMKKITILSFLMFVCISYGQTLNQAAAWPNTSWTVEGTYDASALISDPTTTANFSYDDDASGGGSTDEIQVLSPIIDLTAASTAGETWIQVSHDYNYNLGDSFTLEYFDADTASWSLWSDLPDNSSTMGNWCGNLIPNISSILDIGSFTSSQLAGFRYRFNYTASSVWGWGVCTSSPTISSQAPPSCLDPSLLMTSNLTSSSADISWTIGDSESAWNIEYGAEGYTQGDGTTIGVTTNPYTLSGLTSNTAYDIYVQADCGGGDTSAWVGPVSFYTGYCVPSNTSSSTYINSFSTTGANVNVDNASTGYTNSGYGDYSQGTAIETFPGGSFDFSASIVGGSAGFALWIDFNNDLFFDTTSEVLFNTTGYGYGPFTGTIEIPSDLAEGNYRLRMMTDYSDSNPSAATGDSACSFNSTRGEVEDYTVTLVAPPADAMDWNNLQWLQPTADGSAGSRTSVTVDAGTSISAYAQGYESGVTDTTVGSAGAGIECWIGIHNENTDPATWPASAWSVATFDSEQGNNDEYLLTTSDAPVGTNYVASRWRLNNAGYTYGGTNPSGSGNTPGGPWDGTTNLSIQLIVNPIANDDCSGAIALTVNSDLACGTVTSGSVEFATDSGVTNSTCYGTEDDDVWYSFVATSETHVVSLSSVSGSNTDMYHVLYAGDCNTLGDAIKCSDFNTSETTGLTIGNTYYVQVFTYTSTPGQNTSFDICVGTPPPPPANDNCSGVIDLASLTSPVTGSTTYANNDFVLDCLSFTSAKDVIYSIQVPAGATLSIGQTSNTYDSQHSLRYGNVCPGDELIVCSDDPDTQTETWVNDTGADQTVYWIQSAYGSGSGDYTLSWTMTPLSVDDQTLKQFTYFPNPVNDVLTIKAQKPVEDITVFNMLGQVVKRQAPNTMDCTVDLSAMQPGAYFVQVSIDNTVETVRVLKK